MKKKHHMMIFGLMSLALILAVVFAVTQTARARSYRTALKDVYESALLTALHDMETLTVSLGKAQITSDSAEIISGIRAAAASVQSGLAALPLSHSALGDAIKFANQIADYASTLTTGEAGDEEARTLNELKDACEALRLSLMETKARMDAEGVDFLAGGSSFYQSLAPSSGDAGGLIEYPTLVYDGPFSDALQTGSPKGLKNLSFTREQAMEAARAFVGESALSASAAPDMGGLIPAYGVTVETEDLTLQLAVTKTGGQVLFMSPERADFESVYSKADCQLAAKKFLALRGFGDMEPTYWQAYGGLVVISFAAVQEDVILYPDLVKVQVRRDTLAVVGFESRHYLSNHTAREVVKPAVSLADAQGAVSARLSVISTRLCVIPVPGGETLCYEMKGTYASDTYLVYIDANTGKQIELLKVVDTGIGEMTV